MIVFCITDIDMILLFPKIYWLRTYDVWN